MTQLATDEHLPPPGFSGAAEVEVRQLNDTDWVTLSRLDYRAADMAFTVPSGQHTDFASVPRVFVWFLPRYGRYTKAAILHDYLCRVPVANGTLPRSEADRIFRQSMRELEVAFLRRWIMWAAVRLGALANARGRQGWLWACWQVFPIMLVALPVVGPPAVVIVAALLVFYLVETIARAVLAVANLVRRARGRAQKPISTPKFSLKL
jgi:hypothetical protein